MRICIALLLAMFVTGCASVQVTTLNQAPMETRSRVMHQPYAKIFAACVQSLVDYGYAVNAADKVSGVIATEYRPQPEAYFVLDSRDKVSIVVSAVDSTSTRVVITSLSETRDRRGWRPSACKAAYVPSYYATMFARIDDVLNGVPPRPVVINPANTMPRTPR
jgi:hypothetical protein